MTTNCRSSKLWGSVSNLPEDAARKWRFREGIAAFHAATLLRTGGESAEVLAVGLFQRFGRGHIGAVSDVSRRVGINLYLD